MGKATRLAIVGIKLALMAGAMGVAHAQESQTPPPPTNVRDLKVSDIVVSPDLGYIVDTHPSTASLHAPLIIHIQEAHTNYEAQQHLAGILEQLIKQHGLKLVLVEGGWGDVSLAYLHDRAPLEKRRQVAEKFLKMGLISAEDYLTLVSDYPLTVWGVEEQQLYQQNVDAFLSAEALQESVKPVLASLREAVTALKPKLFSPTLMELETKAEAFAKEQVSLADYADYLIVLARRYSIQDNDYPNLARFRSVRQLEQSMDLAQVQQEQRALMERLSQRLTPERFDALLADAKRMKSGAVTRQEFYAKLEQTALASGLPLEPYPNLSHYISYLKRSAEIKPPAIADELEHLALRLRKDLASTPQREQLQTIDEQLDLLEKLRELRLSPAEYSHLKTLQVHGLFAGWASFLSSQLTAQGLPAKSFPSFEQLEAAIPTLERFYEAAAARDEALVARAVAKLEETREPLAVLITGGFHSPQITRRLKDRGVGVVVVAPRVTQATDETLYHTVLKFKSGRASLEEVQTAAKQAAAAVTSH